MSDEPKLSPSEPQDPEGSVTRVVAPRKSVAGWILLVAIAVVALISGLAWTMLSPKSKPTAQMQTIKTSSPNPKLPPRLMYAVTQQLSSAGRTASVMTSDVDGSNVTDLKLSGLYNSFMNVGSAPSGYVAYETETGDPFGPQYDAVSTIHLISPNGTESKVTTNNFSAGYLTLSQDGKRLAYLTFDLKAGTTSIWSVNADGSKKIELLKAAPRVDYDGFSLAPARWSDDQKFLFLQAGSLGTDTALPDRLYKLEVATGTVSLVAEPTDSTWHMQSFSYSTDGTKLAYSEYKTQDGKAYLGPVSEEAAKNLSPVVARALQIYDLKTGKMTTLDTGAFASIGAGTWSADNKYLAATTKDRVSTIALAGGKIQTFAVFPAASHAANLAWAGDRLVYTAYLDDSETKAELRSLDLATGKSTTIVSAPGALFLTTVPR